MGYVKRCSDCDKPIHNLRALAKRCRSCRRDFQKQASLKCKRQQKTKSALRKSEQTSAYFIISYQTKQDLLTKITDLKEEPQAPKEPSAVDIFFYPSRCENKSNYYKELEKYQELLELWNAINQEKESSVCYFWNNLAF
ncbi:hypothetical protein HYV50_00900 [Candidatus Pacearchaeota archaeon]|nr:hypothetical protein [Candidatus Pacearchaeota archaeon]